jgi:hypothetical protein
LEWFTLKNRSFSAQLIAGLLLATATLGLSSCVDKIYYYPQFNYAGRATPPSGLLQRVMVAYTANVASSGGLEILDGYRDLRSNVQNTIMRFSISGFSEADPIQIINYPEQTTGYVYSLNDGALTTINYGKETSSGSAISFGANAPSATASANGVTFMGAAEQSGQLVASIGGGTYAFSLPNVDKVVVDQGNTVLLAMVRNSNALYRIVKLPATNNPVTPPGAIDCQPLLLPTFCVVPVGGTYDRPSNVTFSLDGTNAYVLNCGPECGGTASSVTVLSMAALDFNNVPTISPLDANAPSPQAKLPVANPVPIPGGVTMALSDGVNLYLSGQQLQASGTYKGLFAGNLTLLNLTSYIASTPISISDGTHTRMLFADDNTLWIGSSQCANGVRAATATAQLAATGTTTQAGNSNCLTMVKLGSTPTAQIIPAVTQGSSSVAVKYPNTDQNQYYYGSLTGICWVQGFNKVYSAYGGQIHAFNTLDGSERDNTNIVVQGTVLDVAYMDALTNSAN